MANHFRLFAAARTVSLGQVLRMVDAEAETTFAPAIWWRLLHKSAVKNILLVNARLIILFLSDTVGGRLHDKRLAEATPYPLPAGSRLLQDLGFLAFTLPQVELLMPTKKPPGAELPPAQQRANQALHSRRLRIKHVNSSVKRCRVVKDRIRLWKQGVRDVVMEICCALHNFRVRLTPWQPMV